MAGTHMVLAKRRLVLKLIKLLFMNYLNVSTELVILGGR